MNNKRSTKRTLVSSVLSLILCMAMLIGTTFAWFTDSVTSANNKIQAGNLKIDLELLDKESGKWNSIKNTNKAIFDYNMWEPGYTDVKILKVENEGNLALKWMAKFISANELTALADVIDVYVCPSETELSYPADRNDLSGYVWAGTVADFVNSIETTTTGTLEADETAYLGIALKMKTEAGNEYQGMDLGSAFDIMIMATQLTAEEDSFDDQYDKDATYTAEIDSLKAKLAAAQYNDTVTFDLSHDAYLDSMIQVPNGVTLVLNGNGHNVIVNTGYPFYVNNANIQMNDLTISGKATYAIYTKGATWDYEGKNATVEASFKNVTVDLDNAASYPVVFNGKGNIEMTDCNITGAGLTKANDSRNGIHIFAGAEVDIIANGGNVGNVLLNANPGDTATITLNAGAKVGKLLLATDGQTATYTNNEGTIDEVITQIEKADQLKSVLEDAKAGETVAVSLCKDITLNTSIDVKSGVNVVIYGDGKTITMDNIYLGIKHNGGGLTISDLTIDGSVTGYAIYHVGGETNLTNVTSNVNGKYALCFFGGGVTTLNNCTVTGKTDEKTNIWFGDGRTVTINGGNYSSMLINASKGAGVGSAGSLTLNSATVDKVRVGAYEDNNGNVVRATLVNNNSSIGETEYEK